MSEQSAENDAPFQCPYADRGQARCPAWRCDCFIETHPDSPFDLHPEDFIVGRVIPPAAWDDPDPDDPPATQDDDPMWGCPIPPGKPSEEQP